MNVKIKREAWVHEAFSVLAEGGVASIKVEALAKRLKVTKGGFYWHFKNRSQLLAHLLEEWRRGRVETIRRQVQSEEPANDILSHLLHLYTDQTNPRGRAIELAVRDWARCSEEAAATVKAVDRQRLESVAELFRRLGLAPEEAFSRAYLFYSYVFGQSLLNYDGGSFEEAKIKPLCASLLIPSPVGG